MEREKERERVRIERRGRGVKWLEAAAAAAGTPRLEVQALTRPDKTSCRDQTNPGASRTFEVGESEACPHEWHKWKPAGKFGEV